MKCPVCNIKIPCVGGQDLNDGSMRQRRYKCPSCKRLVYTLEEITGERVGMKVIPNCTLGHYGADSNCAFERRPPNCAGCGWDQFEVGKRAELLKENGLEPISDKQKEWLRDQWGARVDREIRGLRV